MNIEHIVYYKTNKKQSTYRGNDQREVISINLNPLSLLHSIGFKIVF